MLFLTDFRLFGTLGYDAGSLEIERNGAFLIKVKQKERTAANKGQTEGKFTCAAMNNEY